MCLRESFMLHVALANPFSLLYSIPFSEYTTIYFIYSIVDEHCIVFSLRLLRIMLRTFISISLCKYMFLFLLCKHLRVKILGYMAFWIYIGIMSIRNCQTIFQSGWSSNFYHDHSLKVFRQKGVNSEKHVCVSFLFVSSLIGNIYIFSFLWKRNSQKKIK